LGVAQFRSYIICTSPRSGSTLLCRLLAATGVAGNPGSHFHAPSLGAWLEDYGLTGRVFSSERERLAAVVAAAVDRGTGKAGLFGLRLQRPSFAYFIEQLGVLYPGEACDAARIRAAFGETLFIHLTRADKVAQAVSYVKAQQTGLWHRAPDGTEIERLSPPQDPTFDRAAIADKVAEVTALDADWRAWFGCEGGEPLVVSYDDLSADPARQLRRILAALGRDAALAQAVRPEVAKLADVVSRDWVERFREGTG